VDVAANQQFCAHEHRFGIHGGEVETSMMLHLAPETVHMERAQNFASSSEQRAGKYHFIGNGRSAKLGWAIEDYNPAGAVGNSAAATAAARPWCVHRPRAWSGCWTKFMTCP
jgi:creatinine amidohydrolase